MLTYVTFASATSPVFVPTSVLSSVSLVPSKRTDTGFCLCFTMQMGWGPKEPAKKIRLLGSTWKSRNLPAHFIAKAPLCVQRSGPDLAPITDRDRRGFLA